MKQRSKKIIDWIKKHREQLFYLVLVYGGLTYLLNLPYLNLIRIYISALPLLVTWILTIIIFRPEKEKILVVGLGLFIITFFFSIFNIKHVPDALGDISYYMIFTYILLSLKEIRER